MYPRMSNDSKPTNPKQSVGNKKMPMSCLSMQVISEMAVGMYEGDRKYGRHNYRVSGVLASTYFDACMRHLMAWWEGEDIDPVSGLSHITKLMTSAHVLRDAMMQNMWTDDRPPRVLNPDWLEEHNTKVEGIIAKFPERKPPCVQVMAPPASDLLRGIVETEDPTCLQCQRTFKKDPDKGLDYVTNKYCSSVCMDVHYR
jgi:hypothetical protein